MSVPVWTWRKAIEESSVTSGTKLVCFVISNYLSDAGEYSWPSVKRLMKGTGKSNKSVAKYLREAVEADLLVIRRKVGADGRFNRNIYFPKFPDSVTLERESATTRCELEDSIVRKATSEFVGDVSAGGRQGSIPKSSNGSNKSVQSRRKRRSEIRVKDRHVDENRVKKLHTASPSGETSPGPSVVSGQNHVKKLHAEISNKKISKAGAPERAHACEARALGRANAAGSEVALLRHLESKLGRDKVVAWFDRIAVQLPDDAPDAVTVIFQNEFNATYAERDFGSAVVAACQTEFARSNVVFAFRGRAEAASESNNCSNEARR